MIDFLTGLIKNARCEDFSEEKSKIEETGRNTVLPEIFNKLTAC
jgi:hypothetical protein